ncbi:MAG: apolipoprotein N-acyltransferase [Bacteroidia bacterium]|nr:apolipoprotein N-acyltransferase [Bacteroidia bacterium]
MSKFRLLSCLLLSAIFLSASWPPYGFTPLLFVGFVPLLIVENELFVHQNKYKNIHLFLYTYLCLVLWNFSVSWWLYFASGGGAVMAITANTLLMSITFTIAHIIKKKLHHFFKNNFVRWIIKYNVVFIVCWLTFEYLHHDWDLTYPWLTLGNGLAADYKSIQWYSYTGMPGGSLWVLVVNVFCAEIINSASFQKQKLIISAGLLLLLIMVPIGISRLLYASSADVGEKKINVVVVQPNIDPYGEKFSGNYMEQLQKMLDLGRSKVDSTTDYLVFPETALTEDIWENNLQQVSSITELQKFLKQYPRLSIITGASTSKVYKNGEPRSETAHQFKDGEDYYDNFNTALELDNNGKIQVYHKSRLVPGVERMPFPGLMKPFEKLALDMGGTTGSLGTQKDRTVFTSSAGAKICPIICYESIYPEFISKYSKNGAQVLFIITNDGWWGDTPGYKQHLIYGRLRAIENRRSIARSANTGISCFINQRGDIEQPTQWWQPAVIKASLPLNNELTFFVKHGDYLGHFSFYTSLLLMLLAVYTQFFIAKKS